MDSNQSGAVGGIIWGPFQGSLTHLGASRGLQSQKRGPFWAKFQPSLTPPANPVNFFWSKMACTGVPHIVLYVLCSTRTSRSIFGPLKSDLVLFWPFRAIYFIYIIYSKSRLVLCMVNGCLMDFFLFFFISVYL